MLQEEQWLVQHLVMEALQQYLRTGSPSVVPQHILNQGMDLYNPLFQATMALREMQTAAQEK